jgi:serine/threonine-protein kinase HipA
MRLEVELYDEIIGTLEGDSRTFDFSPTPGAISHFGVNSAVLSVAIPLAPNQRRNHAARRRNWFAELLPEGIQYEYMLAQAGLRVGDTLGFLSRYGRDVAGAVQLWDMDHPTEPKIPEIRALNDVEIRSLLDDPVGSPLANDPKAGRSSLGGVQPKVVLVKTSDGWAQALGGYPSTHILKPQLKDEKASLIFDEEYGARIARAIGLAHFPTNIADFDGLATLVIERYDRVDGRRLHQEDFSQALGARGSEKYQEFGGRVTLLRVAEVLKLRCPDEDLVNLGRMVVLAVAIGNLDMHTKNIGLLHPSNGDVRLAPAYDVVPQVHLNNSDGKVALAVNGKYHHAEITKHDLIAELNSWSLRRSEEIVESTLGEIEAALVSELPVKGAYVNLRDSCLSFTEALMAGRHVQSGIEG